MDEGQGRFSLSFLRYLIERRGIHMNDMTALLPHIKLRFNIEHPTFEDCYTYGYECALAEINEEANPFQLNSKESDQWLEGWWAGFYGEKPLYESVDDFASEAQTNHYDAANDSIYSTAMIGFFAKVMELTGMLAVSAVVGYQVIDLVA